MRISDVGMIPALVQHKDATREQHDAAWMVGLLRALLVTLALVVAAPLIAAAFKEPRAIGIIQGLALRPTIEALASIGIARLTRELKFRELALIYLPGAAVDLLVAFLLAPRIGVWALVAGTLAGSATLVLLSYVLAPHRPRIRINWSEIVPLVDFGRWVLATGVVTLAGTLLTQLAVSRLLGATALGLFFLAVKLAYLPVDAANSVVGAVAFPMFVRLRESAEASATAFVTVLTGMYLLMLPAYGLVFALVPQLETVLGPQWAGTSPMVRILCIAALAAIAGNVLGHYVMGQGNARGAFLVEATNTIVALLAVWPCILLLDVSGAAVAWLCGGIAMLVLALAWLRDLLPGALAASGRRLGAGMAVALAAAVVATLVAGRLDGLAGLVAGGLAGVVVGGLLLWWQNWAFGLQLQEFGALLRRRNG